MLRNKNRKMADGFGCDENGIWSEYRKTAHLYGISDAIDGEKRRKTKQKMYFAFDCLERKHSSIIDCPKERKLLKIQ